tara:strand:+ start:2797 stop:3519 length:723 start_codon:yes stop_codon:yes gene_type:complete
MKPKTRPELFPCQVCAKPFAKPSMIAIGAVRHAVLECMVRDHPNLDQSGYLCPQCNADYRATYIRDLLEQDRGELTTLDEEVIEALRTQETLAANINQEFGEDSTFAQRVADKVAKFGGSWSFIGIFSGIILLWMSLNLGMLLTKPFDPYPFILLNLVLSSLAALQAPVIMMSQNRQSSKDRLRDEHDYSINLKAELEVRLLHTKLDQLLTHQWQRLIEIQQIQMDLIEEIRQQNNQKGS